MSIALLYSGGLDSFALFKALKPEAVVHFIIDPKLTKMAVRALSLEEPSIKVYLFDHRPFLRKLTERLKEVGMEKFLCEGCKRGMIERASQVAEGLIIGDSVGQVASQTLPNMSFITNRKLVFRPLAGSDKEDIEEYLSGEAAQIARRVSKMECPWKPKRVATAISSSEAEVLEVIVKELLHHSVFLGMKTAQELTAMG